MSQTIHDAVRAALIQKAIKENDFEVYDPAWPEPEKFRRMWEKITGKKMTLEEAEQALSGKKGGEK